MLNSDTLVFACPSEKIYGPYFQIYCLAASYLEINKLGIMYNNCIITMLYF